MKYERYTPLTEVNQANVSLVMIDNMSDLGMFPTCLELWNTKDCNNRYTTLLKVNQANVSLVVIDNMSNIRLFPMCQELWNTKDCYTKDTHLLEKWIKQI